MPGWWAIVGFAAGDWQYCARVLNTGTFPYGFVWHLNARRRSTYQSPCCILVPYPVAITFRRYGYSHAPAFAPSFRCLYHTCITPLYRGCLWRRFHVALRFRFTGLAYHHALPTVPAHLQRALLYHAARGRLPLHHPTCHSVVTPAAHFTHAPLPAHATDAAALLRFATHRVALPPTPTFRCCIPTAFPFGISCLPFHTLPLLPSLPFYTHMVLVSSDVVLYTNTHLPTFYILYTFNTLYTRPTPFTTLLHTSPGATHHFGATRTHVYSPLAYPTRSPPLPPPPPTRLPPLHAALPGAPHPATRLKFT